MIRWVYESVSACSAIGEVLVATDDRRIVDAVESFGGKAVMTSDAHRSGTDRIAEALKGVEADLVVNVQGDEPLVPAQVLDELVAAMSRGRADMGTVAVPFSLTQRDPADENAVKVVVDNDGYALYFSRLPIPFCRSGGQAVEPLLHWGVYAYQRKFLEQYVTWPCGRLEACEMLEQLRAIEHGARILVVEATTESVGVDVPEDVQVVEQLLRQRGDV